MLIHIVLYHTMPLIAVVLNCKLHTVEGVSIHALSSVLASCVVPLWWFSGKTSASRVEDTGIQPYFPVTEKLVHYWLPCQAPGVNSYSPVPHHATHSSSSKLQCAYSGSALVDSYLQM